MSVRINLEIGHEAAIRTKRTLEGFTHDWEVFVRGCDHANIQYYVEKIVFYLHETFPKPRRVIKDPPYSVKESGYAGFTLPIEIHLRNKDEPKKITFNYDLNLQQNGPAIIKVQKEKYVFTSPGEEFKSKLLKGGGMVVNSSSCQDINRDIRPALEEKPQLVSKPRLGGSDFVKKHKPKLEEPRISNSFQDLFGPPITKSSKISVESNKPVFPKDKNSNINKLVPIDKDKSKYKHSPHKDKDKEKVREKEKNKDEKKREEKKEHSKDRDKKEKRDKSPKVRSPTPTKRPSSPKRPPSPMPKYKDKDEKKIEVPKEKKNSEEKEKDKMEKRAKKEKREKEKERKESKHKEKDIQKSFSQKDVKFAGREKEKHKETVKENELSPAPVKVEKKDKTKEKEIMKDYLRETKELEHIDKNGKFKIEKCDEKPKHKHKKKDKEKKEKDKANDKERAYKLDKKGDKNNLNIESKYIENNKDAPKENDKSSLFNSPKNNSVVENKPNEKMKKPLNTLLAEYVDSDTSNSSISSHEDMYNEPPVKVELNKDMLAPQPPPPPPPPPPLPAQLHNIHNSEPEKPKVKREKTKKNKDKKNQKDVEKKRKRKSDTNQISEPLEKLSKESPNSKDSDHNKPSPSHMEINTDSENFEDYMNVLRDLQHKILTLQDNAELQKVVQLIAETGRFEISAQTFDFDLCLLERSTIKQLQNFFESAS